MINCRQRVVWAALLGAAVMAFSMSACICVLMPEIWELPSSSAPVILLCLVLLLAVLAIRGLLPFKWWSCIFGGVILGITNLVLVLLNSIVITEFGRRSGIVTYLSYNLGHRLVMPALAILDLFQSEIDISSSHVSDNWLFFSWIVVTLLSAAIWSLLLALLLFTITALWRKALKAPAE